MAEGKTVAAGKALTVDVAVVGGGPTGGLAALVAASAGFRTALIAPPVGHDPRTTALFMPAIRLLDGLGVWDEVAHEAAPLITMRIIDDTGRIPRAPEISFDAHEIDLDQFGFNIENDVLNEALAGKMADAGVTRVAHLANTLEEGSPARVVAADQEVVADLVVAADGAQSLMRHEAGLGVSRWSYDQAAFVTTLSHQLSHGDTSTEFHTAEGPFTLVPLPGERSSLVWVSRPDKAAKLKTLDPGPLARAIERRSHFILGRVSVDGPRGTFALEGLVARRFGQNNVVLVGEAGHRFPPIGAQGLNLGMRDVATLSSLLEAAKAKGTLAAVAREYDLKRRVDIGARTAGVDLLNRSLLSDAMPVAMLRTAGITAARHIGPVRRALMRAGL